MNQKQAELQSKILRLDIRMFEESDIIVYKGFALPPPIPTSVFDRYWKIEQSGYDDNQKLISMGKVKLLIKHEYESNTSKWVKLEDYIKSLDVNQFEILEKEADEIIASVAF